MQPGGGLLAHKSSNSQNLGKNVIIGGLVLQILFFGVFIIVAILFHVRAHKDLRLRSFVDPLWQTQLFVLYIASSLIMVRSIFRVVEFSQGFNGYLLSHELFLYVFDGVLMLSVLLLLNFKHPYNLKVQNRLDYEMPKTQSEV